MLGNAAGANRQQKKRIGKENFVQFYVKNFEFAQKARMLTQKGNLAEHVGEMV